MRPITAFLMLAAGAFAAQAQTANPIEKGMLNPDAPISYSADHFAADANAKTGVFYGNVIIRQGEVSMRADAVRFHVVENKPDMIYAQGHVVVDAPSGVATGDSGVYDVNPRVITLKGHVILTKDQNIMRGQQLVVNLVTGQATLTGGEGQEGRIHGLFVPRSLSSEKR